MLNRREVLAGALGASLGGVCAYSQALPDDSIRALLAERIGVAAQNTGIVAVLTDAAGSRLIAHGSTGTPDHRLIGGDTVFEIGSLTKVLTALLLADMVARGEVAMADPVVKYLPASAKIPEHGKPITLLDLATYTSGLPDWPGNLKIDWTNPLAHYTVDKLYAFLSGYKPNYEPGTHYEYANLGFGLLGLALANRARKSYEALLLERICAPLGLRSTRITLTDDMRSRLAQGHKGLAPTPLWDMPALAGGGAVRSTANDVVVLLEACMGLRRTPLASSLAVLLATRRPTGVDGTEVGLGWFISADHGDEIVWKSGLTGGFTANIGFSTVSRRGSIVLSNSTAYSAIEIGFNMINSDFSLRGIENLF
jgi:serine-type D-Ala-D-Ala carboxypeptidase/endopeptidase